MKKIYTIILLASSLCMMTAVSCQRETMESFGGEAVCAELSISPSVSSPDEVLRTKGELINRYGEGNIPFPTAKTFFATAWDADGESASIPWSEVKYFGDELGGTGTTGQLRNMWRPADANGKIIEYNWKPGLVKTFYAYSNLPEGTGYSATVAKDETTGLPEMTVEYVVPTTAEAHQDLLLGCYKGIGDGEVKGKTNGTANIVFSHALTAVAFQLGTVVGAASFGVTSLGIEGVAASGSALMKEDGSIVWTLAEDDGELVTTDVSQSVATTPAATAEVPNPEIGVPFMVIPQTFASDSKARLKIGIKIDGREVYIYEPLKGVTWEAGKVNIYTVDYNGHEGIQLWANGPYWATKNVGASKPEDYGWYFSWGNVTGYIYEGDINTLLSFNDCTFKSANGGTVRAGGFSSGSFETPGKTLKASISPSATNDAAFANIGSKWRMPTAEECSGLTDPTKTAMTYTKRNGVAGYLFTGVQEGFTRRSIFIPASGFANGGQICFVTKAAILRTSTWSGGDFAGFGMTLTLGYYSDGASTSLQENSNYRAVEEDVNYGGRVVRAVENTAY